METKIGEITHYYGKLQVAVLELIDAIKVGDRINVCGHTTDFIQTVESLEIDHQKVDSAGPGQEVALKVWDYVRKGDEVFKVSE